jgi:hypothetical protein
VQADLDAADTTPTADEELARQVAAALQPEAELATSIGDHLPYVDDAGQLRDPAIQRDRPNPDSRLFGQATTRTRYRGHANHPSRRGLTEGDAIGARTSLHPLGWTQGLAAQVCLARFAEMLELAAMAANQLITQAAAMNARLKRNVRRTAATIRSFLLLRRPNSIIKSFHSK